jgi:exodeoxyribonuclease VII large subunit
LRHKQEQYFKARQSLASTSPARQVEQQQGRLLTLEDRMIYSLRRHTQQQREKLATLGATLNAVSPLATLERGYAIARGSRGEIIRSVTGVEPGQSVDVVVEDGRLLCTVDATSGDRGL